MHGNKKNKKKVLQVTFHTAFVRGHRLKLDKGGIDKRKQKTRTRMRTISHNSLSTS